MDEAAQCVLLQEHGQFLLHLPPQLSVMSERPPPQTSHADGVSRWHERTVIVLIITTIAFLTGVLPCTLALQHISNEAVLD